MISVWTLNVIRAREREMAKCDTKIEEKIFISNAIKTFRD